MTNKTSLNNIKTKWLPEINKYAPKAPIVLVGTKGDMRTRGGEDLVMPEEAQKVASEIGAIAYIETSARTRKGVDDVFNRAIEVNLKKGCLLM